jgi:hypothetical protein
MATPDVRTLDMVPSAARSGTIGSLLNFALLAFHHAGALFADAQESREQRHAFFQDFHFSSSRFSASLFN